MRIAASAAPLTSRPTTASGRSWRTTAGVGLNRRVRWFTDTASGAKHDRHLARLMDQVRRGKLDVVVTFKLDRLARSLPILAQRIGEFQAHAVALVCPSQGIDMIVRSAMWTCWDLERATSVNWPVFFVTFAEPRCRTVACFRH